MKELYCWRCGQVMPILDDEEYAIIYRIFLEGVERRRAGVPAEEAMKIVREAYSQMTGAPEIHENAILQLFVFRPTVRALWQALPHQQSLLLCRMRPRSSEE